MLSLYLDALIIAIFLKIAREKYTFREKNLQSLQISEINVAHENSGGYSAKDMITLNHLGISHAVIIALPERAEHVSRLKNSMIDGGIDPESGVTILPAWNGRELHPPKSWKGTRGAWG